MTSSSPAFAEKHKKNVKENNAPAPAVTDSDTANFSSVPLVPAPRPRHHPSGHLPLIPPVTRITSSHRDLAPPG